MSSPTPPEYEHWRSLPSIMVNLSLPPQVEASPSSHPVRVRSRWMPLARITGYVGVLAITAFSVAHADDWRSLRHLALGLVRPTRIEAPFVRSTNLLSAEVVPIQGAAQELAGQRPGALHDLEGFDRQLTASAGATEDVAADQTLPASALAPGDADMAATQDMAAAQDDLADDVAEASLGPVPPGLQRAALVHSALLDGRRQSKRQNYAAADLAYRRALAVAPGHPMALRGLAEVALAQGKLDQALRLARKSVARSPYHPASHVLLGDVLRAHGATSEADVEYARAAELSRKPVDPAARSLPPNPF